MTLSPELLQILVCPKCKGKLEYRESPESLVCHACRLDYPVEDGGSPSCWSTKRSRSEPVLSLARL
jgi:hypothetical protein